MELVLRPFRPADAATVLRWLESDHEAALWASLAGRPADVAIFDGWHAEPGVEAWMGELHGTPVAYGEVWGDAAEDEAELARVLVDPAQRGAGVGRSLVAALAARAGELGYEDVWVRVVPGNQPALAAYRAAGFRRTDAEEERRFNAGQPVEYVWMRR